TRRAPSLLARHVAAPASAPTPFPPRRSSDLRALAEPSSAVPIVPSPGTESGSDQAYRLRCASARGCSRISDGRPDPTPTRCQDRSEEHTSELQSPYDHVCRLLREKKNNNTRD